MADEQEPLRPTELNAEALKEWVNSVQNNFALLVKVVLQKEGLTPYALARRLRGIVSQRSVYDFLEGKDTRLKTLLAILDACDLEIGIGRRYPRLRDPKAYTKMGLIEELRRMEERSGVGQWLQTWDRVYYPRLLKSKWESYERQKAGESKK